MDREIVENTSSVNKSKKNIGKNKKIIIASILVVLLFSSGIIAYVAVSNNLLIKQYTNKVYPNVYVMDTEVGGLDKDQLNSKLDEIANQISTQEISVTVGDNNYKVTKGDLGVNLDVAAISNEVMNYGKNKNFFKKLSLLKHSEVKKYDYEVSYDKDLANNFVAKIEENTTKDPVNAGIDISNGGQITISPSQNGTKVNSEDLLNKINDVVLDYKSGDSTEVACNIEEVKPNITSEALQSVNSKVSTFTTTFKAGPSADNIAVGTTYIDNAVLMPGEEFSTVGAIGYTTPDKGYVLANTYMDGKVVKGYGGGVCQIATTLYNAELRAGIVPTERQNHMMTVGYVGLGLDATIGDEAPDLKFKNPYDYPVVINAYTTGGSLVVEMWSEGNVLNGITYEPVAYPSGSLYADTYLYGYDANGNCVFEEYLNSSSYMPFS